jgi:hypothetical protein
MPRGHIVGPTVFSGGLDKLQHRARAAVQGAETAQSTAQNLSLAEAGFGYQSFQQRDIVAGEIHLDWFTDYRGLVGFSGHAE